MKYSPQASFFDQLQTRNQSCILLFLFIVRATFMRFRYFMPYEFARNSQWSGIRTQSPQNSVSCEIEIGNAVGIPFIILGIVIETLHWPIGKAAQHVVLILPVFNIDVGE